MPATASVGQPIEWIVGGASATTPAGRPAPSTVTTRRPPGRESDRTSVAPIASPSAANPACPTVAHATNQALRAAARSEGVDERLLRAIAHTESRFDRFALSPKGAIGLMQLMPQTARQYEAVADGALWDVHLNARLGARHLRRLLNRYNGNFSLAAAAYNAGEGAVQRHGSAIPPYPETLQYVALVLTRYLDALDANTCQPAPPAARPF